MDSRLTQLQKDLLEAFFERENRFVLSGGAALAGFYLGHRTTLDLDLFCRVQILEEGDRALRDAATRVGATVENIQTSPSFLRRIVNRSHEAVVVDLVHDLTPTAHEPVLHGSIRVDSPSEIFANKICTVLSRAEIRDLVDLRALEDTGLSLDQGLEAAIKKDAGVTPAQLAWVLSQICIGEDARVPGETDVDALRTYVNDLRTRLERMSFPG